VRMGWGLCEVSVCRARKDRVRDEIRKAAMSQNHKPSPVCGEGYMCSQWQHLFAWRRKIYICGRESRERKRACHSTSKKRRCE
jgi:hypothetical protein